MQDIEAILPGTGIRPGYIKRLLLALNLLYHHSGRGVWLNCREREKKEIFLSQTTWWYAFKKYLINILQDGKTHKCSLISCSLKLSSGLMALPAVLDTHSFATWRALSPSSMGKAHQQRDRENEQGTRVMLPNNLWKETKGGREVHKRDQMIQFCVYI